jgi:hypothetical protein
MPILLIFELIFAESNFILLQVKKTRIAFSYIFNHHSFTIKNHSPIRIILINDKSFDHKIPMIEWSLLKVILLLFITNRENATCSIDVVYTKYDNECAQKCKHSTHILIKFA